MRLLFLMLLSSLALAQVWEVDPNFQKKSDKEIYDGFSKFLNEIDSDYLEKAKASLYKNDPHKEWYCAKTAIYMWLSYSRKEHLPVSFKIYVEGKGYQDFNQDMNVPGKTEDEKFEHFSKQILDLSSSVKELNEEFTYPIKIEKLQGGTLNLTSNHTYLIAGVDEDPNSKTLVTGQWVFTHKWGAEDAFASLKPYQDENKNFGLRNFKITTKKNGKWLMKNASEHEYLLKSNELSSLEGLNELEKIHQYRELLFAAHGMKYSKKETLLLTSKIMDQKIQYRIAYIEDHKNSSTEDASTTNTDGRIVNFCHEIEDLANQLKNDNDIGPDYLINTKVTIPLHEETQTLSIKTFCEAFESSPSVSQPGQYRWLADLRKLDDKINKKKDPQPEPPTPMPEPPAQPPTPIPAPQPPKPIPQPPAPVPQPEPPTPAPKPDPKPPVYIPHVKQQPDPIYIPHVKQQKDSAYIPHVRQHVVQQSPYVRQNRDGNVRQNKGTVFQSDKSPRKPGTWDPPRVIRPRPRRIRSSGCIPRRRIPISTYPIYDYK